MDGSTVSVLCRSIGKRSGVRPVWPARKPVPFRSLCRKYPVLRSVFDVADVWRHVRIGVWGLGIVLTEEISSFNIV